MSTPFYAEVTAVSRLSPHFVRVTFGGAAMDRFQACGYDQWFRLLLPRPGEDKPTLPRFSDDEGLRTWYNSTPEDQRPIIRNYTVRSHDPRRNEIDVDFVVHGDTGPASIWAQQVEVGNVVGMYDQGAMFAPAPDTDWYLLVADETGLPAIAATLETLPAPVHAKVFIEVPLPADRQELAVSDTVAVEWFHREIATEAGNGRLIEAVTAASFPAGQIQAFVVGESSMVKTLRRHLVNDRGVDKDRVTFCGYWRHDLAADESE